MPKAAFGFALALGLIAASARADLQDDIQRLAAAWAKSSTVERFAPHVERRGTLHLLFLPRKLTDPATPDCVTIAVLSAIRTSFIVRFLPRANAPVRSFFDERPVASVAGAATLTRCGKHKAALARLAVDLRSPRVVVEVLAARGPSTLEPLESVLPYRDPGPSEYFTAGGVPPVPAPLSQRVRFIKREAKRQGATRIEERTLHADASGSGQVSLVLRSGCHRIVLLDSAPPPSARGGADVDLELVLASSGRVVASDQSDSADASARVCFGERSTFKLEFVGAWPRRPLVLLHASQSLPPALPQAWPAGARAGVAWALWRRHIQSLPRSPVYQSLGVGGDTLLPVALEPDGCYLLSAAAMRSAGARLSVTVDAGARRFAAQSGLDRSAVALAFCANGAGRALIDLQAQGAGALWLLAIWQTSRKRLGALQP